MGYVGLAMSLAILLAPLLGGVVYNAGGYYPVFGMAFGLIVFDIVARVVLIEKKFAKKWIKEDEAGDRNGDGEEKTEGEGRVAASGDEEQANGSGDPENEKEDPTESNNTSSSGGAPIPDPSHDSTNSDTPRRQISPILRLLGSARLLAALFGCFVYAAVTTSFDSTLPLFTQSLFNWTSLGAGLIFLPLVVPSFLGPVIGAASDRYGPKWLSTGGFVLAIPFSICLRFVTYDSLAQKVLLCAMLAGVGLACALVMGPLMAEITWVVEAEERRLPAGALGPRGAYAQAYGLFNMAFSGGALVGPILGGLVKARAGWGTMGWCLAIMSAVAAVIVGIWSGGRIRLK